MSATAFNRARKQQQALEDAKARDDAEQNKTLSERYPPEKITEFLENNDLLGSPPYADEGQLINIPADADLDREKAAYQQAVENRNRVLTPEEIWDLSNSHCRDDKTKAIPDADENGQDRTLLGQKPQREAASAPYMDPRVPERDGRLRATEPEETRPDADTSVSDVTRQDPVPPAEDDDPKTVEKIAVEGEKRAAKRIKDEAKLAEETAKQTAKMLKDAEKS